MFNSNEQYTYYKIVIKDELEEKIHEFNILLLTAINLMPCLSKGRLKKHLIKLLEISSEELIVEQLDSFISAKISESLYEQIFQKLHSLKCEVIIPDKKTFVISNQPNELEKNIIRHINHEILSRLFIDAYEKLRLLNQDLEQIIKKFADTQKLVDEIKLIKINTIDFVGIKNDDISSDFLFDHDITYTQDQFNKYVNLKKCDINESTDNYHLAYLNIRSEDYINIGEYIFPFDYKIFRHLIKKERQAFYDFQYIKKNLDTTKPAEKSVSLKKRLVLKNAFLKYFKMTGNQTPKILADLENNFYTKNSINEEDFFKKSYLIKKNISKDDHSLNQLKHFQFIIPHFEQDDKQAFFGIYNDDKSRDHNDKSKRGLKSWVDKNGQTCNYDSNFDTKDEICEVMTLEPKYSFYYQQHFFEDLLDELFKEMRDSSKILDILYSVKLNEREYDFILLTDTHKIFVIEAKTKLTGFYIEKQLQKFNDLHNLSLEYESASTKTLLDNYIIVGFNSDKTCRDKFNFFIDKNSINIADIEQHDKAYSFKVPISGQKNKELYCIADIYYDNLKTRIEKSLVP